MAVDEDASDEHDDVLFGPCAPQNKEHAAGAGNATSGKGLRWGAGQAVRSAACFAALWVQHTSDCMRYARCSPWCELLEFTMLLVVWTYGYPAMYYYPHTWIMRGGGVVITAACMTLC